MEQKVMISIFGRQTVPGEDPQVIELITEGTLEELPGGCRLRYEDTELTGVSGNDTSFELRDGTVTLIRSGELGANMTFERGQKHYSVYRTPYGHLTLGVVTHEVDYTFTEKGGKISIDYDIEIEHAMTGSNSFRIKFTRTEE